MLYKNIFEAIKAGDEEEVIRFLGQRFDINAEVELGSTLLHFAATNGTLGVVSLLLDRDADINAIGYAGLRPLHKAAYEGKLDIVSLLLERGASVNAEADGCRFVLHSAVVGGKKEIVNLILDKGGRVDIRDHEGNTPLHFAAWDGYLEIASLLLKRGASVNAVDDNKLTPLHKAAYQGEVDVVSLLLDKGAKVNAKDNEGSTPLHQAALEGEVDVVSLLLDEGADVNAENDEGLPVFHAAFYGGKIEIINLMLARGANIDVRDADGSTLLGIAVQQQNLEIVSFLIDKGAHLHAEDMLGYLVSVFALFQGDIEIFKILVKAGAGLDEFQYALWRHREPEYIDLYDSTIVAWRACTGQELSENERSFLQSEDYKRDFVQEFLQSKSGQIAYKGAINSIISPDEEGFLSSEFYDANFAKAYLEEKAASIIARLEGHNELTDIETKFFNSKQFKKLDASKRFEKKLLEKAELVSNVFIGTNKKNADLKVKLPAALTKNILDFIPLAQRLDIQSQLMKNGLKKVLSELKVEIDGVARHLTDEEANTMTLKEEHFFELYTLVNTAKQSADIVSFAAGESFDLRSLMIKLQQVQESRVEAQTQEAGRAHLLAILGSDQGSSSFSSSNQIRAQDDAENMVVDDHQALTASLVLDDEFKDEFMLHLFEACFGSDQAFSPSSSSHKRGCEDDAENFPNKIPCTEESRLAGDAMEIMETL